MVVIDVNISAPDREDSHPCKTSFGTHNASACINAPSWLNAANKGYSANIINAQAGHNTTILANIYPIFKMSRMVLYSSRGVMIGHQMTNAATRNTSPILA